MKMSITMDSKKNSAHHCVFFISIANHCWFVFPKESAPDTTIVESKKGFNFPLSEESVGDPEMNTQYLKPDTSLYYNKDDYDESNDDFVSEVCR